MTLPCTTLSHESGCARFYVHKQTNESSSDLVLRYVTARKQNYTRTLQVSLREFCLQFTATEMFQTPRKSTAFCMTFIYLFFHKGISSFKLLIVTTNEENKHSPTLDFTLARKKFYIVTLIICNYPDLYEERIDLRCIKTVEPCLLSN